MEAFDNIIDIFTTQESDFSENTGRFIDLHNTKRTTWNNRRHYGL